MMHHWLVYECSEKYEQMFNSSEQPSPGLCFTEPWMTISKYCQKISLGTGFGLL